MNKNIKETLYQKVKETPFIDTHEHLSEEKDRISTPAEKDSWISMMGPYISDDLISAGLSMSDKEKIWNSDLSLNEKWSLIEPYWNSVKNTGYVKALIISFKELYGIKEISFSTIELIQEKYLNFRKEGFYQKIFSSIANIESCQVNSLEGRPFRESDQPLLLMQDLSIISMFSDENSVLGSEIVNFTTPAEINIESIDDWYKVIDWYFDKYGKKAVAVKSQNAYYRGLDYEKVTKDTAVPLFYKRLKKKKMTVSERKALEDHLFWYSVDKANEFKLPVKLHTGYYAGVNSMPLKRVAQNPGEMTDLCMKSPETKFVFMHMTYPYQEELLALTKHHSGAIADMCWAWIINPLAAKEFLKQYLVTAPVNKILTFGGDYIHVETIVGHAEIARRGITQALAELVEESWFSLSEALEIVEPIMCGNARNIFNLEEKNKILMGQILLTKEK